MSAAYDRRKRLLGMVPATAAALALAGYSTAATAQQEASVSYEIETVAEGFDHAWGMAFLPDSDLMLVTERPGRLKLVDRDSGEVEEISGLPDVFAENQGGLLDVALHPNYEDEPWVYMTWAGSDDEGLSATHLGRARLDVEARELTDLEVLYVAEPFMDSDAHFGSRIVFDNDNRLFMTLGDRNSKDFGPDHYSQDLSVDYGSTLRFEADGSIPADNPFVDDPDARDAIFSYGHRNSQGMAVHPETGEIWQNEHGENNGDEINIIVAGGNFGWPIATYGHDYQTGEQFAPTPPEVPETIDPVYHWGQDHPEGFPASGFVFYDGDAFPEWRGNALMGNLWHEHLGRFTIDGRNVEFAERLVDDQGWRIRDVAVGPDNGFIYLLIDDENMPLVRLRPADG